MLAGSGPDDDRWLHVEGALHNKDFPGRALMTIETTLGMLSANAFVFIGRSIANMRGGSSGQPLSEPRRGIYGSYTLHSTSVKGTRCHQLRHRSHSMQPCTVERSWVLAQGMRQTTLHCQKGGAQLYYSHIMAD